MYFVIDCSVLVAGLAALSGVLCTLDKEMEIDWLNLNQLGSRSCLEWKEVICIQTVHHCTEGF